MGEKSFKSGGGFATVGSDRKGITAAARRLERDSGVTLPRLPAIQLKING